MSDAISNPEIDQLRASLEQLAARVTLQEAEIKQLRGQLARPAASDKARSSRRQLLKRLAAVTGGLVVAGTLVEGSPSVAQAAVTGGDNPVDSTATVRPSATFAGGLPTMRVNAETNSLVNVTQTTTAAVLAAGSNYGLIAVSGQTDVSPADFTLNGIVTGTLKPAAVQGRSGSNGNLGVHGLSDSQVGVLGQAQSIAQLSQNFQVNDTNGLYKAGVTGASDSGIGVVAASSGSSGLYANSSNSQGYSVYAARGGHDSTGTLTNLNLAPLYIEPGPTAGPPVGNGHRKGELHVDAAGKLYICATSGSVSTPPPVGSPVELRRAAPGLPSVGVFYQLTSLVLLAKPLRILGDPNLDWIGTFPTIPAGVAAARYFKIEGTFTNSPPSPYTSFSDTIPANATAVVGTVVAFNASSIGFLTIFPANAAPPAISTLTYSGGGAYTSSAFTAGLGAIPAGQTNTGSLGLGLVASVACQISLDVVGFLV